ncbi:MAG: hypothetical protein A2103_00440 [Gammaproteobacteria bacterium GWF2_41_13]|nr:MAG: hypothetical protein A2103_00440 [Gammaproteobacteria bacterium GWF2_41_13]
MTPERISAPPITSGNTPFYLENWVSDPVNKAAITAGCQPNDTTRCFDEIPALPEPLQKAVDSLNTETQALTKKKKTDGKMEKALYMQVIKLRAAIVDYVNSSAMSAVTHELQRIFGEHFNDQRFHFNPEHALLSICLQKMPGMAAIEAAFTNQRSEYPINNYTGRGFLALSQTLYQFKSYEDYTAWKASIESLLALKDSMDPPLSNTLSDLISRLATEKTSLDDLLPAVRTIFKDTDLDLEPTIQKIDRLNHKPPMRQIITAVKAGLFEVAKRQLNATLNSQPPNKQWLVQNARAALEQAETIATHHPEDKGELIPMLQNLNGLVKNPENQNVQKKYNQAVENAQRISEKKMWWGGLLATLKKIRVRIRAWVWRPFSRSKANQILRGLQPVIPKAQRIISAPISTSLQQPGTLFRKKRYPRDIGDLGLMGLADAINVTPNRKR